MNYFEKPMALALTRIYIALALVAAAVFAPLSLSFIPLLLFILHLYLWWRPAQATINLLVSYFFFFALALLFQPLGATPFPLLISLPVLITVNHDLLEVSPSLQYRPSRRARALSKTCVSLLLIPSVILPIAILLGSLVLALACAAALVYLGTLIIVSTRKMPPKAVEEVKVQQRMVAGSKARLQLKLTNMSGVGGWLYLESPYRWLRVEPQKLPLDRERLGAEVFLSPPLSGPSTIRLSAHAVDRWGLVQSKFELEAVELYVIPRARYAAWLARRYLAQTKAGSLPLISTPAAFKAIFGMRQGIEYYGDRPYQPGDSLSKIDWKHSFKLGELVSKEFSEFRGQSAIVLINLTVGDEEEADELAYKIITTALSLAKEGVPAALAAYDHRDMRLTTRTLPPNELLVRSLEIAREMVTFLEPLRYLSPPDVTRLRANISRFRSVQSEASVVLLQLLEMEYRSLADGARLNPATEALAQAFGRAEREANILVISQHNHDAQALAFNKFYFARKGHAIIEV